MTGLGHVRLLAPLLLAASACGGSPLRRPSGSSEAMSQAPPTNETPADGAVVTRALAAGAMHTCALEKAGLYCWGQNANGALGIPPETTSSGPVAAHPPRSLRSFRRLPALRIQERLVLGERRRAVPPLGAFVLGAVQARAEQRGLWPIVAIFAFDRLRGRAVNGRA